MRRLSAFALFAGLAACAPVPDNSTQSAAPADSGSAPAQSSTPSSSSAPASSPPPSSTPDSSAPPASSSPPPSAGASFSSTPPGQLVPGSGGTGVTDSFQWAPALVFPIGDLPAFANSQVWGHGGAQGPGGGQCDSANYSYPWHDNFCETRSEGNHRCSAAQGHQGQDIRPATCVIKVHPVVAAEDGRITNIGSFSVTLTGNSGRVYRYLHIDMAEAHARLSVNQSLRAGDPLGHVSHDFKGTPTTTHLHFEIIEPTADYSGPGYNFVPPYTSLVAAYQRALSAAGQSG